MADRSPHPLQANLYRAFSYLGLMSVFGTLLYGFRYDPDAPAVNYLYNVLLYVSFAIPHLVMTRSWFKQAVWGTPGGSPRERRFYIALTTVTWLAVFIFHQPVPGPQLNLAPQLIPVVTFLGNCGLLFGMFLFFSGNTPDTIDQLVGTPGAQLSHSHGPDTPLFTEGSYASVRHPMYRAALIGGLCSLLIHPHAGQLLWAGLLGGTFLGFIPIEERQMLRARGDDYRAYMQSTPYRVLRGVW